MTHAVTTAELEQRNQEWVTLIEALRDISRTGDMTEILGQVSKLAARVCGAHRCTVVLRRENGEEVWKPVTSTFGDGREDEQTWRRFEGRPYRLHLSQVPEVEQVIREQRPLFIADARESSLPDRLIEPSGIRSVLLVPLIVRQRVIGLMALDHVEEGRAFTDRQVDLAASLAALAALAVEEVRLHEEAQRGADELSSLETIAREVITLDAAGSIELVLVQAIELTGASAGGIAIASPDQEEIALRTTRGVRSQFVEGLLDTHCSLETGLGGRVARTGEAALVRDLTEDPDYVPLAQQPTGSALAVPIQAEEDVAGVICLHSHEPGGFDRRHLRLAEHLAGYAGIAVRNARLYGEAQRRVEELTALRNIDVALTATLSLDEVLQRIHGQIRRVIPTATFYVGIYDEKEKKLRIPVIVDQDRRLEPVDLHVDRGSGGLAGWVVRHGRPLWIDDWEKERETLPADGIAWGTPTRSLMVLPLISRGETIGVISAQSYEPHAFDEDHRRLFSAAANQVAIAVENARLFEQTRRQLTKTQLLQEILQAATSRLDFDHVLEHTIRALHRALGIEHLSFAIPDEEGTSLRIHPSQIGYSRSVVDMRVPVGKSLSGRAYQTGKSQVVSDVKKTSHYFEASRETRSEINVPVKVGERVIAVLNAESPKKSAFDDDLALFEAVAGQLGVVLENTQLYERLEEQKNELSEAFEKLSEVERLRAQLVQNVSHELRTPFSLVQGYIDLMLEGDLGPVREEQREALEVIRSRMGTLKTLFRDLTMLDEVSRRETSSTPTSMVDAARIALDDFKPIAKRAGIRFQDQLPEELPAVQADKEQLIQVFAHLLDNAIKFSPDGGTVTLQAWEESREGTAQACVSITDEGIGIGSEHLDHIFERFYQADGEAGRQFGGMGIGLALVREIVEGHGGHVDVQSTPQEGSTFTVTLPQARRLYPRETMADSDSRRTPPVKQK